MEDKIAFISSLGKITFFLMLVLSIFLFTVKSKNKIANYIFGTLLLVIAFDLSGFFIADWFEERLNLNILKTASSLLQMPLFYLYILAMCYSNFRFKPIFILHAFLFFIFAFLFKTNSISGVTLYLFEIVGEIQWFVYMIAVFLVLRRYSIVHQENYSLPKSKMYTWLFQFTILSCIGHSFVFIRWCLSYLKFEQSTLTMNIIISISTLMITTWFVFKALYQPDLFKGIKTTLKPIKSSLDKEKDDIANPTILKQEIEKLQSYMVQKKPYLDFELTLQKLANELELPEKELSILINHQIGKHFFDFVNDYRISEAKTILENPEEKHQTILEILYYVGFNSKSSFYTAFKKVTGKTPTLYRKEQLAAK